MSPFPLRYVTNFFCHLWGCSKHLLPIGLITLAGCNATTGNHAYNNSSLDQARRHYLSQTQADPLGAYLASRDFFKSHLNHGTPAMAATALDMLGTKYRFGGGTPSTGFDCSGLVVYAARKSLGIKLPRESREIAHQGTAIKREELREGDLVFFNTRGHRNSHVGIYLGDEKFVHAPRTGSVVRVENMDVAYWAQRYNGARRLDTEKSYSTARLGTSSRN